MNVDKLNGWLTFVTNIALLIGVVVVIYELQQNNLIARAQTRSEISRSTIESAAMYSSPEAIRLTAKFTKGEEFSIEDNVWLRTAWRREFRSWENVHYQYRLGLFDENEMESYRYFWQLRADDCSDLFSGYYQELRMQLEPHFRSEMDRKFTAADC